MLNSKFNIYKNGWLDLVFAGRNQAYGAYVLRKEYGRTLTKALFFTLTIISSLLLLLHFKVLQPAPIEDTAAAPRPADTLLKVTLVELPLKKQETQPSAAVKSKPPRVAPVMQVSEEMPSMDDLEKAVIGQVNIEGEGAGLNDLPAEENGKGDGNSEGAGGSGDNIYSSELIEKYPQFPGGMDAFAKFLQKNLRYPSLALENGISGRVVVSFIVEKDGRLTDIKLIKGIGFGCDEEALRVLKKSPLWLPGIQNKQKVRVQYIVPVVFRTE